MVTGGRQVCPAIGATRRSVRDERVRFPPPPSPPLPAALLRCERRTVAPDRQRVIATGEVDIATGQRLADALRAAQAEARHVVLDLAGTTFMDMSGVRGLLAAAEHARLTSATFEIVHATPAVERLLALTGADRRLKPL